MADITSLILTDLLKTFMSLSVYTQRDKNSAMDQWMKGGG